jgi:hypothetical protein
VFVTVNTAVPVAGSVAETLPMSEHPGGDAGVTGVTTAFGGGGVTHVVSGGDIVNASVAVSVQPVGTFR